MKSDDLFDLIGKVDDKYIAELYNEPIPISKARMKKPAGNKKWLAMAACLAVILVGGAAIYKNISLSNVPSVPVATPTPAVTLTTVILDVNPSIQLELASPGTVKSVTGLNDDANALLKGVDIKGKSCADGMDTLVTALESGGYLTKMKNSVLVTVVDSDKAQGDIIRGRVVGSLENAASDSGFDVSVLSQVIEEKSYEPVAEQYGISVGKAALIEKIAGDKKDFDYSELAELNIHALNQIIEYICSESDLAIDRVGKVSGTVSDDLSRELEIGKMDSAETLDLAVAMSNAYEKLCEMAPDIDATTYTGYKFSLKQGTAKDGSRTWTITAQNTKDNSLPSVSVKLGKDIIPDLKTTAKDAVSDTLKLACNIFGLVSDKLPSCTFALG